ncbi:hypothetical protein B5G52_12270 [Pseudoalteromonas sp. A601]|uniref:hypothetical protein n=1 Tax=Pseudoalteromonas sp. A601 TaxID=1967839 RepID=UPI000B3CB0DC|nr:hypothetical protein [Pseudoalteromonas sp. A601]OUS71302.1 hypothetical protein B5G52_12270 [Pseudoalteromonas sp. A601]
MKKNKSFLLGFALELKNSNEQKYHYDEELNLNVFSKTGLPVSLSAEMQTQSKTHSAPGDDDPDYQAELCF